MKFRSTLFASAASLVLASPALAQESQPTPPAAAEAGGSQPSPTTEPTDAQPSQQDTSAAEAVDEDYGDEEAIVIQGARARGSVIGDIPPQNILDSRDVRATGATSITDLLDALAPQIGSSQGRGGERPVLLLNGQRISGFREIRDIPTEAIERVEILPEEVALKYGYRADQKVVNIVLRQRFRSTTAKVGGNTATEGGYAGGNADLTEFRVEKNGRTTLNAHVEGNGMLTEAERNIILDQTPPAGATIDDELAARSLLPSQLDAHVGGVFNRTVLGDVSGTLNTEIEHKKSRALIGLSDTLLEPLARNTSSDSAHAGLALNGVKSAWHWTLTGNADLDRSITSTDNGSGTRDNRARETTSSGDIKATANGNLFSLPAGNASTTVTLAGSTVHLDTQHRLSDLSKSNSLGRTTGEAAINLDLPISRRNRDFSALGNLTVNANAEVDQLSDFGTLTTIGAGANWSPVDRLNLITSWTREEGPPSINQLGDPVLVTPNTRIFDFVTGDTVLVTATTGGNPNLQSDRRNVLKLGANWQPFEKTDFRLRGEYVHQTIARPISSVTVTPAIEAAFPDRFVRDEEGQLVAVDLRPLNFESSQRDTLRIGFDFSKPLKSHQPSQAVRDQMRAQFGGRSRGQTPSDGRQESNSPQASSSAGGASPPAGEQAAAPPQEGGRGGGFRGGFGGRGGRFFGGGDRGRITFSLTDTITFVDKVTIAPGLGLDYLHGDAAGQSGGTPRHRVEAQAGYFNNGLGARLVGNLRSGTTVNTLTGDDLRFSPLATFDLRLFANPGDIPEVVVKHPWFRGTQVQLEVQNVFNSKPKVHDAFGNVPLNYQPDLLDPLGRTIMISFRKLFLPNPSWFRRQFEERRQEQGRP
ncbi:MAG TPA: TonB-dependent receptor [Sphingomicrobium sp.]|nr:TonB-dependent receptor [Sphingomicrobium sp.]